MIVTETGGLSVMVSRKGTRTVCCTLSVRGGCWQAVGAQPRCRRHGGEVGGHVATAHSAVVNVGQGVQPQPVTPHRPQTVEVTLGGAASKPQAGRSPSPSR